MLRMKSYSLAVCLLMGTLMGIVQAEEEKSADIRPNPETLRSLEKEINAARGNSGLSTLQRKSLSHIGVFKLKHDEVDAIFEHLRRKN